MINFFFDCTLRNNRLLFLFVLDDCEKKNYWFFHQFAKEMHFLGKGNFDSFYLVFGLHWNGVKLANLAANEVLFLHLLKMHIFHDLCYKSCLLPIFIHTSCWQQLLTFIALIQKAVWISGEATLQFLNQSCI
jgi:hypothetical protein